MNENKILLIKNQFDLAIEQANDAKMLQEIRVLYLGRKGFLQELMSDLPKIEDIEEKKKFGQRVNELKGIIESAINLKNEEISAKNNILVRKFDVTGSLPNLNPPGNLHFYTKFLEEVEDIFLSMGYELFDGPEVEDDFHNFTALNIGPEHPARDMHDTFWLNQGNKLLRTHTSPVQIRAMLKRGAPLAGIATGRVFRQEAVDATHEFAFSQCEGIFVDQEASLANLFGVAKLSLQKLFGKPNLDIRVRPGFFPFVVPGVEIDMRCVFCKSGCNVCKKTTWVEVYPGGMIHPNVLKFGGIDPSKYSGFAFCLGIERLAMLRHQITDIRLFKSGDLRFIQQF